MHTSRFAARTLMLVAGITLTTPLFAFAQAQQMEPAAEQAVTPIRAVKTWNLPKAKAGQAPLAIEGYDPVAYFPEGGGSPKEGSEEIATTHQGVTYRFVNAANRDAFLADPAKYEPAHGGWCSWAMKDGEKVEVDPKSFIVRDGRLFLFYNGTWGNTRSKWLKLDHAAEAAQADSQWKKLSGEEARAAKPEQLSKRDSTLPATPMAVGDTAPDFTLPDAKGRQVSLATLLADGPVVLTWYRGGWCPYCNKQLSDYQLSLTDMKAMKAQLVAISPQTPDNSLTTVEKNNLAFAVLSDQGNLIAKQYGLAYTLPADVVARYKNHFDLAKYNGDDTNQLPLTATYVIDKQGVIRYAFVNEDYTKRAEVTEILAALKQIN
jgi:peroxiredoxin/YHS domain-containing protein